MKKTLFLALMLVIGATAFAQQQMATLNHNDTITVFYGHYALKDAHNAAVAGDIVTLSPGTFEKCDITKPITLRGAGATIDTIAGTFPTMILGEFIMAIPNDSLFNLSVNGIRFGKILINNNTKNVIFEQCFIEEFYNNTQEVISATFISCIVKKHDDKYVTDSKGYFTYINCAIGHLNSCNPSFILYNTYASTAHSVDMYHLYAYNSILFAKKFLKEESYAYNSILIGRVFSDSSIENENNNMRIGNITSVFETVTSPYIDDYFSFEERYILKEEIATSFLGSDGTEVGIHGGMFPFDTRPSYMVVKKCNVANKSTIDGKLSVDIEVMVEE